VYEAQVYDVVIANIRSQTVGNCIDIYLAPLIEDLKIMWEEGVAVFDAYHQENFQILSYITLDNQ